MDATRPRRTRDAARQRWYGRCRCLRFARFLRGGRGRSVPAGFPQAVPAAERLRPCCG